MASLKQTKIYGALEVYNGENKVNIAVDPENYPNGVMSIGRINIDGIEMYKSGDSLGITYPIATEMINATTVNASTITADEITELSTLTFTGNTGTISGLKTLSFETGSPGSNSITKVNSIELGGDDSKITNLSSLNMKSNGTISFSSLTSGTVIEGTKIKFMKPTPNTTSTILDASELNIGTGMLTGSTEPFRIRGSSNSIPDTSFPAVARNDRDLRIIAPTYISSGYDISYNPNTKENELFEKNILSIINNTLLIKSYNTIAHKDGVTAGANIIGYEYSEDDVASFDNEKIKIYKPLYGYGDNNTNGYGGITIARDDSSESEDKDKNITLTLSPTKISFNGRNPIIIGGDGNDYGDNLNNNYKSIAIGHKATNNADKGVSIGYNAVSSSNSVAIGNMANATGANSITIGAASGSGEENTGDYSIVIGNYKQPNPHSIAIGNMISNHYGSTGSTNGYNIVIGDYGKITGSYNVVVGARAQGTGSAGSEHSTSIGYSSKAYGNSAVAIGANASASKEGSVAIGQGASCDIAGDVSFKNTANLHAKSYLTDSDKMEKTDIKDFRDVSYLKLIMDLRPVSYRFNYRSDYAIENGNEEYLHKYGIQEYDKDAHSKAKKAHKRTHSGFIAQEVKAAIDKHFPNDDHLDIVSIHGIDTGIYQRGEVEEGYEKYSMNYSGLIPVLVKAIQEQQKEIEYLRTEIEKLKK